MDEKRRLLCGWPYTVISVGLYDSTVSSEHLVFFCFLVFFMTLLVFLIPCSRLIAGYSSGFGRTFI